MTRVGIEQFRPRNRELLAKGASVGAIISGRHNYDLSVISEWIAGDERPKTGSLYVGQRVRSDR